MSDDNTSEPVAIPADTMRRLMRDIFGAIGVPERSGAIVVDTLMDASLSGYDSHGFMRIMMYCADIRAGHVDP